MGRIAFVDEMGELAGVRLIKTPLCSQNDNNVQEGAKLVDAEHLIILNDY